MLDGVDLLATVDAQGAFCEVFVLRDAADGRRALATVTIGTQTARLTVRADAAVNLAAVDRRGHAVFTAPTPMMWDSATTQAPAATGAPSWSAQPSVAAGSGGEPEPEREGQTWPRARASSPRPAPPRRGKSGADALTGRPPGSGARRPGKAARVTALGVAVGASDVRLDPGPGVLAAPSPIYPLYYDPIWTPANVSKSAWATVTKKFPGSSFFNDTPDPTGHMQVGNSGGGGIWSHTLINFGIPAVLNGATINSASLTITEVYSTARATRARSPSSRRQTTLTSSATRRGTRGRR